MDARLLRTRSLLALILPLLWGLSAPCSPSYGDSLTQAKQLRQEAQDARADADKKRAQAQELRKKADDFTRQAQDAHKAAADAKKMGNAGLDRALNLEVTAQGFEIDARKAFDQATTLNREAETLEKTAHDKESAADRIELDALSAPDAPTTLYKKTRDLLQRCDDSVAEMRQRAAGSWLGTQYDAGVAKYTEFDNQKLSELYGEPAADLKKSGRDVEDAWTHFKAKKNDFNDFAGHCYDAVHYGLQSLVDTEFRTEAMRVRFLAYDCSRRSESEEEAISAYTARVQQSYLAGSITFDEKNAMLAAFVEEQAQKMRPFFDEMAKRYAPGMHRLARFRRDWSTELKSWHDLAAKNIKKADDAHAAAAATFERDTTNFFTKDAEASVYLNVNTFAYQPGSPDRLNTYCGKYKWCKPGVAPEIQDPEDPSEFRMWRLVDVKLEDSVTPGKAPGAAGNEAL